MAKSAIRTLGLDVGIASIGWALIDWTPNSERIVGAGVWTFDAPETAKERTPKSAVRRLHRGQRRVISRRRQRMNAVRALFVEMGLLPDAAKDALKVPGLDPWRLRAGGLDRLLSPIEFAVALGHIARHRGFRSNAKRDAGANAADDTSKMKKAIAGTQERLGAYRTVGEMMCTHEDYIVRRRNRSGDYSRSIMRSDHEAEVRKVFHLQRAFGNRLATPDFEERFADVAFSQRPLRDSDDLVGPCPFEPGERRTARRGYSFERFRLLTRLTTLRLSIGRDERPLTVEELSIVANDFGQQKKLSFKRLRKLLKLDQGVRFSGIAPDKETGDVVARSGGAADGTAALRDALGDAPWQSLIRTPAVLDRIAETLTYRADEASIRVGIEETGVEPLIVDAIMAALQAGKLKDFKGAGHISAKAARALIPHLADGLGYAEACAMVGYDHARSRVHAALDLGEVRGIAAIRRLLQEENQERRLHALIPNPIARKAVFETLKQVKAIMHEYGLPDAIDAIHVELARDVGRSKEERDEISRGIDKRNAQKDRLRDQFRELLNREPSSEDLLRFELWNEQNGRCLYTDEVINPEAIVASNNSVQVDHILPWSRFGDDSFINKTLCIAGANQAKKGRTPFEWLSQDKTPEEWQSYIARIEAINGMKGRKKRNYTLKDATEKEEAFRSRNLGDTRYAVRVVTEILKLLYPEERQGTEAGGERRVLARPGALTARLRQAWGIEHLKKVNGERVEDDRHHAVDAMVIAAITESMLHRLTLAFQRTEREGRPQAFKGMDLPWPSFRDDVRAARDAIFVARAERCRARGEAHAATIYQVRERDGVPVVFERKAVDDRFTVKDLERLKDSDRNAAYVEAIRAWLEAGKPKDRPPLSPKGDPIRKVRLATTKNLAVNVRQGTAGRGEMARVDVFRKQVPKGKWQHFLVPIYPHEIATLDAPPNLAITPHKPENEWVIIDDRFEFLFSIMNVSLIEITKPEGEVVIGYFRGADRAGGQVSISCLVDHTLADSKVRAGIGGRNLRSFRKFRIDRLGRLSEVKGEVRTWRGKACT